MLARSMLISREKRDIGGDGIFRDIVGSSYKIVKKYRLTFGRAALRSGSKLFIWTYDMNRPIIAQ